jgi:hypothetical protein
MALPLPIKFLALSAFPILLVSPINDQARAEESTATLPPAVAPLESASREPATASATAQEAEYAEMMTPTKAELAEVVDSAAAATVEHAKKFKTVLDLVNEFKSRLNDENKKVLTDYLKDAKLDIPLKVSYVNKKMTLRFDGGNVIAFNFADVENHKIQIDSSVVDIGPSIPLKDQLSSIEAALKAKFKSAGRIDLLLPKAKAGHPVLWAWAIAGAASAGYLGAVWKHDDMKEEWLERNLKVINLANATCQKYQDREIKTIHKTYTAKVRNKGKGRHRRSFRYVEYERTSDVEMSPKEIYNKKMRALVAARGERPDENGDQGALVAWDKEAKEIRDEYDGARLTRGDQQVAPRVLAWTSAIKKQMCHGKAWWKMQGLSLKGFWTDEDDDEADEVLSFDSLCHRAEGLGKCIDELNQRPRLSETGNRHLREIMEKAKIGKSFRRAQNIPIRTQKAELVD